MSAPDNLFAASLKDLYLDWALLDNTGSGPAPGAAAVDIEKTLYVSQDDWTLRKVRRVNYDSGGQRLLYLADLDVCVTASFGHNVVDVTNCASAEIMASIEVPRPQQLCPSSCGTRILCATESSGVFEFGLDGGLIARHMGCNWFSNAKLGMSAVADRGVGGHFAVHTPQETFSWPMAEFGVLDVLFEPSRCLVLYANNLIMIYDFGGVSECIDFDSDCGLVQWIRSTPTPGCYLVHTIRYPCGFLLWQLTIPGQTVDLLSAPPENWGRLYASRCSDRCVSSLGRVYETSTGNPLGCFALEPAHERGR